jgi:hypothetical protein
MQGMDLEQMVLSLADKIKNEKKELRDKINPVIENLRMHQIELKNEVIKIQEQIDYLIELTNSDNSSVSQKNEPIQWKSVLNVILKDGPRTSRQIAEGVITINGLENIESEINRIQGNFRSFTHNEKSKIIISEYDAIGREKRYVLAGSEYDKKDEDDLLGEDENDIDLFK